MIAVLFELWPAPDRSRDYFELAAALHSDLETMDGFVSIERFQSLSEPGKYLSVSVWRDEEAVAQWRRHARHLEAQAAGRSGIFSHYRLRVAEIHRDYSKIDRREAPDSAAATSAG